MWNACHHQNTGGRDVPFFEVLIGGGQTTGGLSPFFRSSIILQGAESSIRSADLQSRKVLRRPVVLGWPTFGILCGSFDVPNDAQNACLLPTFH